MQQAIEMKSQSGFTLVQLLVALFLVSVIGGMAMVSAKPVANVFKQRAAVVSLKRTLIAAKARAMANPSVHCGVYFQEGGNLPSRAILFDDVADPDKFTYDSTMDKRFGQPVDLPVGTRLEWPSGGSHVVVFRGDGSAWNSVRIAVITGTRQDTLRVLAATGHLRVTR